MHRAKLCAAGCPESSLLPLSASSHVSTLQPMLQIHATCFAAADDRRFSASVAADAPRAVQPLAVSFEAACLHLSLARFAFLSLPALAPAVLQLQPPSPSHFLHEQAGGVRGLEIDVLLRTVLIPRYWPSQRCRKSSADAMQAQVQCALDALCSSLERHTTLYLANAERHTPSENAFPLQQEQPPSEIGF